MNVCSNVPPVSSMPLSNEPSFAVAVCGDTPVLVHVTVVPVVTWTSAGSKARSTMSTAVLLLAGVEAGGAGVGGTGSGATLASGRPASPTTSIVPRISGWKMHRKGKLPASANVFW